MKDKIDEMEKRKSGDAPAQNEADKTDPFGNPGDLKKAADLLEKAASKVKTAKHDLEKLKKDPDANDSGEAAKLEKLKSGTDSGDLKKLKDNPDKVEVRRAEVVKREDQAGENLPWGIAVPGKVGIIYTPYSPEHAIVDVNGFKKGEKVKCPYTDNFFKVP